MDFLRSLVSWIPNGIIAVLHAALLLLLAVVIANIVRNLVTTLLGKLKLGQKLPEEDKKDIFAFIAKLVYLLVFLLFVPAIFSALGMSNAAQPINNILNTVWGYIPNILAAALILVVGFMIARLVRQLLIPIFKKLNIDKLQEKAGIKVKNADKLSLTLAYIVYVLIVIPIVITALQALKISTISDPAVQILNTIFAFIPNIIGAIIVIIIGLALAKFAGQIVERLIAASGLDAKFAALTGKDSIVLSKLTALIVKTVIIIFSIAEGTAVLKLAVLTDIVSVIIAYLPSVLAALLILAVSFIAANFVEKVLKKSNAVAYAIIAKTAILVIGAFMMLNQLGIAASIVNAAFIIAAAALGIAFAVAFGIGGRTFAAHMLEKLEKKLDK